MRRKRKAAKTINTAFGLILILAVILASPLFGFGLGLAAREWMPPEAPAVMASERSRYPASVAPEPITQSAPDLSPGPLPGPVSAKMEEEEPAPESALTPGPEGEPIPIRKDSSEGEAFNVG